MEDKSSHLKAEDNIRITRAKKKQGPSQDVSCIKSRNTKSRRQEKVACRKVKQKSSLKNDEGGGSLEHTNDCVNKPSKPKNSTNKKSDSLKKCRTSEKNDYTVDPTVAVASTSQASTSSSVTHDSFAESSGSESDWEEVKDIEDATSPIKTDSVVITLPAKDVLNKKRRHKQFDMDAWFRRQMNRFQKEVRSDMHKVHLLCLLGHGIHLNHLCLSDELLSRALSQIPVQFVQHPSKTLCTVNNIMKLVRTFITIDENLTDQSVNTEVLQCVFEGHQECSPKVAVCILLLFFRSLGFDSRFVLSLQPLPLRDVHVKISMAKSKAAEKVSTCKTKEKKLKTPLHGNGVKMTVNVEKTKSAGNKANVTLSSKLADKVRNRTKQLKSSKGLSEDETDSDWMAEVKEQPTRAKRKRKGTTTKRASECDSEENNSEDIPSTKKAKLEKNPPEVSNNKGYDWWVEVFIVDEDRWICVDCVNEKVDQSESLLHDATDPLHYVLAFDNELTIKDVTKRYSCNWMKTCKLRVEADWWSATLKPYTTTNQKRDAKEDLSLQTHLLKKPLPASVAEYKNHPLYVLPRHLLKFEAIYPESALTLGFVKGEAVYPRDCVHTLHSRETWLKEARLVRVHEEPYKIVKARPKRNKPMLTSEAPTLPVFGYWQTEDYIAPPAVDGKVPRNEYGNVELFKACMLPVGTVHLQLPGLNKVAKKLNMDCVPAMVGWDFHGGYNHPILDGFVVCEENQDILVAAWDEDQEIQKERQQEKKSKKACDNWKVLTKGLLIRERLKKRFNLQEPSENKTKTKNSQNTSVVSAAKSWPSNMHSETLGTEQSSLFPFEKM